MSLVPILYTSIILFSILMIVIITISYIAYKIRNKENKKREANIETYRYISAPRELPERRDYQTTVVRVVPSIKKPELRRTQIQPAQPRRTTVLNNSDFTEQQTTTSVYNRESRLTSERESTLSRTNGGSYRSRIEILNKLQPTESPKEKFIVNGSGSIALPKYYENFKAIQYYSDDEDELLYKPSQYYR